MGPCAVTTSLLLFSIYFLSSPLKTDAFWTASKTETKYETDVGSSSTTSGGITRNHHDGLPPGVVRADYGVDVSFPMQYATVSTNYPWLPHNVDPNVQTPRQYEGVAIQPLGNRQKFYDDFLQSCVETFGARGERCRQNEQDRIAMSLRQPQSMQVRNDEPTVVAYWC